MNALHEEDVFFDYKEKRTDERAREIVQCFNSLYFEYCQMIKGVEHSATVAFAQAKWCALSGTLWRRKIPVTACKSANRPTSSVVMSVISLHDDLKKIMGDVVWLPFRREFIALQSLLEEEGITPWRELRE